MFSGMFYLCMKDLKKGDHEDETLVVYTIADDFEDCDTEAEDISAKRSQQIQYAGLDTARSRCYRLMQVCVVLLCVLLLTAVTVLCIKFNILSTKNNQLQTRYNRILKMFASKDEQAELGWRYFNSSFYYMSTEHKNWDESRQDCRERGADLVIINSREELEFIKQLARLGQFWIGLSDRDTDRVWNWVDGTELINGTGFWTEFEPNDVGNNEDCVEIWGQPFSRDWNDRSCSHEQQWICE